MMTTFGPTAAVFDQSRFQSSQAKFVSTYSNPNVKKADPVEGESINDEVEMTFGFIGTGTLSSHHSLR